MVKKMWHKLCMKRYSRFRVRTGKSLEEMKLLSAPDFSQFEYFRGQ